MSSFVQTELQSFFAVLEKASTINDSGQACVIFVVFQNKQIFLFHKTESEQFIFFCSCLPFDCFEFALLLLLQSNLAVHCTMVSKKMKMLCNHSFSTFHLHLLKSNHFHFSSLEKCHLLSPMSMWLSLPLLRELCARAVNC